MLTVAGTYCWVALLNNSTEPRLYNSLELVTTLIGLRRLLKTMRGAPLGPTAVMFGAGSERVTDAWSKSKDGPVVKVWVTVPTMMLPAVSFTPVMVSV